ncbi:sigma-54 dependent transcriptional regulator [uncultured Hyphomicrobium sp.]|uniref:sigma-54 dependent transcriptional regulator n=1 Tax=uncultured Hyphomicrobium sp. TaxID=194373 RepID=UPI0025EC4B70|nr:sigma-54 dependent transcriptional regulator [uncultured Hyphomicrobium sp.]
MERVNTVLIVARLDSDWSALVGLLSERQGYRVLTAANEPDALQLAHDVHIDLVIAEDGNKDVDGCTLLAGLRLSHPDVMRVLVLAKSSKLSSRALREASVYQYLRKPLDIEQAALVVMRSLEARELARRHRLISREFKMSDDGTTFAVPPVLSFQPQSQRFEKLVYVSEMMSSLCDLAKTAAKTDLPILIQGETGTGKELLARAIHYNSSRKTSPLLVQNCGGMNDELLQSELFGHRRGAFTGAVSDRLGLFRAADGGTVFLDEISDVSASFQVSLLRFLQEGEVKPLGSDQTTQSNVRIIAASNRSLAQLVNRGEFRRDLYYRLKGFEFEVPPLRDRTEDIAALAEFFAAKHSEATGRKILGLSANLIEKLSHYDFPGNIRELENEIRRLVVLTGDGEYLTTRHLSPAVQAATQRQAVERRSAFSPSGETLKDQVESLERHLVEKTLHRHRWNQSKAADELGLSRVGLANKIRRYGLNQEGPHDR